LQALWPKVTSWWHHTLVIKMAPMTMPFGVVKEIPLDQYRPGDKVRFQIKVVDGTLDITVMEKLK